MFAYCMNRPTVHMDAEGYKARPVGAGVQLELDIGGLSVGLEVIVYWDVKESNNGAPVIAVYLYGGISVGVNDPFIASIVGIITDNADLLVKEDGSGAVVMTVASMIGDDFNVSVSGVFILGNEKFDSTKDYEESFTSVGTTLGKFKGSIAYSETCTAISFGVTVVGSPNLLPSWGVSKTYYQQLFSYSVPYER